MLPLSEGNLSRRRDKEKGTHLRPFMSQKPGPRKKRGQEYKNKTLTLLFI